MEDVRTEVVTDWPTYIKDNFNNLNNGREIMGNTSVSSTKNGQTRRSMDNLLKVDTSFGRGFQVSIIYTLYYFFQLFFSIDENNSIYYVLICERDNNQHLSSTTANAHICTH